MMMMPSIFSENLFDDFFDNGFAMLPAMNASNALYGKHAHNIMKTDVRETDNSYELDIDLPGFKKDEIKLSKREYKNKNETARKSNSPPGKIR